MLGLYALISDRRARAGSRPAAHGPPRGIRAVTYAVRLVPYVFATTFTGVAVGFAIAGEVTRALLAALVVVLAASVAIRVELLRR
jgi:hypothetical protein